MMKTKELKHTKGVQRSFTIDPTLTDKYADQPLFKEKTEKTNEIIRKYGLPDFTKKR